LCHCFHCCSSLFVCCQGRKEHPWRNRTSILVPFARGDIVIHLNIVASVFLQQYPGTIGHSNGVYHCLSKWKFEYKDKKANIEKVQCRGDSSSIQKEVYKVKVPTSKTKESLCTRRGAEFQKLFLFISINFIEL